MRIAVIALALLVVACDREVPVELQGPAIAYSGYRDGQSPKTGVRPSQGQVEEDLRILEKNWKLIRVYAADRHAEDVLEIIRREKLDLKVMQGIWLDREPGYEDDNARQIEEGIRLAREYSDIIVAVNVGNETLIEWTEHPVREEQMIRYVRQAKAGIAQPITVADNYVWWRDFGDALAREVDFITIHTYPLWENRDIDRGLSYTIENYEQVKEAHPDKTIVIGEAGWATYTEGNLHVLRGGDEQKQIRYYEELTGWAEQEGVVVFLFEAFDEPWKGTGTEGHWGLFTVDRKAKPVMQALYPELMPDGPTSPSYPDDIETAGPEITVVADSLPGSVNPLGPGVSTSEVVQVEGGTALRLAFTGESWGGVYLILGGYDASSSSSIGLRLKLPDEVARLELKLEDPDANAYSFNVIDHETNREESGWRTFTVPVDVSEVARLGLWNPQDRTGAFVAGDLVVDDVKFE